MHPHRTDERQVHGVEEEEEAMDKMYFCHDTDEADETLNSDQIKRTLQKYAAQTDGMKELNKKSTKGFKY